MNLEDFLEKIKKCDVDMSKSYKFRLSNSYFIKSIIFIISIIILSTYNIYSYWSKKNILALTLFGIITIYICYYIFELFSYNISIKDNKLIVKKNLKINLKEVKSLKILPFTKVGVKVYRNCLEIITNENKRYIISLDISNKYNFVALISKIADIEVTL
ncbi:hypothetical protein [Caviibacter abscessus]|uniref:hypothetical protein n=1 Tax=Caviibacter abscessus TaxID=1766719 RepID=UPI0008297671|nr:hypothetical protein [Caviibacter abscessus]